MNPQEIFLHLPIIGRFAIVFGLIVILPKISERFGLPGVLGLLVGGILLGPNLLGLINPKASVIELFSELGKLLLMFFAGYEVNLHLFKKVGGRAIGFGFLTFIVPLSVGTFVGTLLGYGINASILIGSLMSSHTLLGLPIVKELGLTNSTPSIVTVGATIFTDIAAMLVLAICLSIHSTGFSTSSLLLTLGQLAVYIVLIMFGLSWLAKQFYNRYKSEELRFAVLILTIAIASILAEAIELEGIVGAFLTGIAVNKAIGEESQTGKTLSVISQSLFIPVFFLSTGFLVDFKIFTNTIIKHYDTVLLIVGGLFIAKYIAAWLAGTAYRFEKNEKLFMWSLTIPQVAATLAATIVAYNAINKEGIRLLSESMLNTVVVLIIVTSVAGPMLTKKFGLQLVKTN